MPAASIDDAWNSLKNKAKFQQATKKVDLKWLKLASPEYEVKSVHYLDIIVWQEAYELALVSPMVFVLACQDTSREDNIAKVDLDIYG